MPFTVAVIESTTANFPPALRGSNGTAVFPQIWAIGNLAILEKRLLGFFCSIKCPGEIILRTYDLARALRNANVPVIGGFHSPMEKECLTLLLRGAQPVIVCPARSLEKMRIPAEWRTPLMEDRLLLLSPFTGKTRRVTADLARKRNEFVAIFADAAFVAHATSGSKTEQFCLNLLTRGKRVLTLEDDENANLLALGARPVRSENISEQWATNPSAPLS
jgi:predicted Rossmann fold nucleotide-binding protein DprA/Smf involved in DNA uptake